MRPSRVKVLLRIIGKAYRPDRDPAGASGQGRAFRMPSSSGEDRRVSPVFRSRRRRRWAFLCVAARRQAAGPHAPRFSLDVTPGDGTGRFLRWIDGEWAGGDQIDLTATIVVRDADLVIRSDHQPAQPTRFTMSRGNKADFTATC